MWEISLQRRLVNRFMLGLSGAASVLGIVVLGALLVHVIVNGITALTPQLVTGLPTPLGVEGGGIAHALIGSIIIVGIACAIGIPIGIGAGIFLAEYASPRVGGIVRFTADVMAGVPSIVIGIFAFSVVVARTGGFSGLAGAFALIVIALPIVARTTEEVLRLVPP